LKRLSKQPHLFVSEKDTLAEQIFDSLQNTSIQTAGPEIVSGRIYDFIDFNAVQEDLFRQLVIARLAFLLSKLKTTGYLYRYQGILLDVDAIDRFLDKLNSKLKEQVEQIAFAHTDRIPGNNISVVFYDITTLCFEASDEDDLRKTGLSKDGKHSNLHIYTGLLAGLGGYTIGYDIFEGNIHEGYTLIPFLEKRALKFKLDKPVVVADAGLLSNDNIRLLEAGNYEYIIGARLKNEPEKIKQKSLLKNLPDRETLTIIKSNNTRLIVAYAANRAAKDEHNRYRGLQRLEKQLKTGRLTKASINNKGYNKYLKMQGEVSN
jgi:transposase